MKPSPEDYFKGIPIDDHPVCEDNIFLHHDLITGMMIEAVCILDFQKRNFYDVSDHGFFLCGYTQSEVKSMGYNFFNEIIHPDDMFLWVKMHNAILNYLQEQDFEAEGGSYFSCAIRIKYGIQFKKTPFYMMSFVKLKPVFVDRRLKYGLCFFSASPDEKSGNLQVHFKEENIYNQYSFTGKKWISKKMLKLSLREREILMLYQQGLSRKNTADTLCVSDKTIKNTRSRILKKSGAKEMIHVESFANTHRLIYNDRTTKPK